MKNAQRPGYADHQHSSGTYFFEELSEKLLEERSERRRKIVYGCLAGVALLLMARLYIG